MGRLPRHGTISAMRSTTPIGGGRDLETAVEERGGRTDDLEADHQTDFSGPADVLEISVARIGIDALIRMSSRHRARSITPPPLGL